MKREIQNSSKLHPTLTLVANKDQMDGSVLHLSSLSGNCLNLEETASLLPSMSVVQDTQEFAHVSFWGKILGTQKEYLIIQGIQDNIFKKKFLYRFDIFPNLLSSSLTLIIIISLNSGLTWSPLAPATAAEVQLSKLIYKRFTGDPGFVYNIGKSLLVHSTEFIHTHIRQI